MLVLHHASLRSHGSYPLPESLAPQKMNSKYEKRGLSSSFHFETVKRKFVPKIREIIRLSWPAEKRNGGTNIIADAPGADAPFPRRVHASLSPRRVPSPERAGLGERQGEKSCRLGPLMSKYLSGRPQLEEAKKTKKRQDDFLLIIAWRPIRDCFPFRKMSSSDNFSVSHNS